MALSTKKLGRKTVPVSEPKHEDRPSRREDIFSRPFPIEIQGRPAALVSCLVCGSALLVEFPDLGSDSKALHAEFHA